MTQQADFNPTSTVAHRMKELRQRKGWSAAELADRCRTLGVPELNRSVIANIESGRRKYITVDEAFVLAVAFEVALIHLLIPTMVDSDASLTTYDAATYEVTPTVHLPIGPVRSWARGELCLPGQDPRIYHSEVPEEEYATQPLSIDEIEDQAERLLALREKAKRYRAQANPPTTAEMPD